MDNLELAEQILENVIAKEFNFIMFESEIDESGNMSKLYSPRADKILNEIVKILDEKLA